MGIQQEYLCQDCGQKSIQNTGSGMTYQLVRCRKCGREKNIPRYEYQKIVSGELPPCECGGEYSLVAPLRCPHCGSINLTPTDDELIIEYD